MPSFEEDALRRFAAQIGAEFSHERIGLQRSPQVVAIANGWRIKFYTQTESTNYTSWTVTYVTAPYASQRPFRFHVYRGGMFSRWGKALRIIREVETGDPEFDRRFIITGSDETTVRALFAKGQIRQLVLDQPRVDLELRHDQLCFEGEFVTDTTRLKSLYRLFVETLNQLREIGVAR